MNSLACHVLAPGGNSRILSDVIDVLHNVGTPNDTFANEEQGSFHRRRTIVSHIHPSNCSNLTALMKALVTGFVDRQDEEEEDEDEASGTDIIILNDSPAY